MLTAAFALAVVSIAVVATRGPKPLSPEEQMYEIASGLRCPVCRNLSVLDSPSPLAAEMRLAIEERLNAGESPDEIRRYFSDRYGEWILLNPRSSGLGWLIWAGPPMALGAGVFLVCRLIKRRSPVSVMPVSDSDKALIQRELTLLEKYE